MKKVVFRVDSGNHVGIGHVSRSLTLADELAKNNWEIFFITKNHAGYTHDLISNKYKIFVITGGVTGVLPASERNNYSAWLGNSEDEDLAATNKCLEEIQNVDLIILDNYSVGSSYEKKLSAKKVMVVDDLFNRSHFCDLLLNQNITAEKESYRALSEKDSTMFLMGPEFALLRGEFRTLRESVDQNKFLRETKKILVFFGGKDVGGDTLRLVQSLNVENYKKYNFHFVMDSAHKDYSSVANLLKDLPNVELSGLSNNFADVMLKADLFIGAGGATAWERSALGIASAILCIADNQLDNCLGLSKTENAYYLGKSLEMDSLKWNKFFDQVVPDKNLWNRIRVNSFKLVDALGTERVSAAIRQMLSDVKLEIRKIKAEDKNILLEWRNDPKVYKYALNPNPVKLEDHERWFAKVLSSPSCFFYMAMLDGKKMGTVRYDITSSENEAEVSISLAPEFWGKGLAYDLMMQGENRLKKDSEVKVIHARVIKDNISSMKLFSRLFTKVDSSDNIMKFKKSL